MQVVCSVAMDPFRDKSAGRFTAARLFRPDSIAMIGAASDLGGHVMANLRASGFTGDVAAVDTIEDIAALRSGADLAVIATPPSPELLRALAAKGVKPVAVEKFNIKDVDMTAQLLNAKEAGAEAVLTYGIGPELAQIANDTAKEPSMAVSLAVRTICPIRHTVTASVCWDRNRSALPCPASD